MKATVVEMHPLFLCSHSYLGIFFPNLLSVMGSSDLGHEVGQFGVSQGLEMGENLAIGKLIVIPFYFSIMEQEI